MAQAAMPVLCVMAVHPLQAILRMSREEQGSGGRCEGLHVLMPAPVPHTHTDYDPSHHKDDGDDPYRAGAPAPVLPGQAG